MFLKSTLNKFERFSISMNFQAADEEIFMLFFDFNRNRLMVLILNKQFRHWRIFSLIFFLITFDLFLIFHNYFSDFFRITSIVYRGQALTEAATIKQTKRIRHKRKSTRPSRRFERDWMEKGTCFGATCRRSWFSFMFSVFSLTIFSSERPISDCNSKTWRKVRQVFYQIWCRRLCNFISVHIFRSFFLSSLSISLSWPESVERTKVNKFSWTQLPTCRWFAIDCHKTLKQIGQI